MNEEKLNKIVEKYNDAVDWSEEYYMKNEDNCYADYCGWGWSEAGLGMQDVIQHIDCEDTIELIDDLEEAIGWQRTLELIMENTTIEVSDIYIKSNEVYSVSMDEVEEQPSDELLKEFEALDKDEQDFVRRNVSQAYISDDGLIYLDLSFNRWVAILDTEFLLSSGKTLLEDLTA